MATIPVEPLAFIRCGRAEPEDDHWGPVVSEIVLVDTMPECALDGIEAFSHAEIFFIFDRVAADSVVRGARHPRNNTDWPKVGILAQRGKRRPNRLGATVVAVLKREGRVLTVQGLDAIAGTPVIDIKPVMREFLPCTPVTQPDWADALMADYW